AGDIEPRLVGEAHAGLERRAVASHEVGRLVHVHPDAVAGSMREPRQAVVLAPALVLVEGADGLVDRPDRRADLRRLQRELLSALHRVPELALARRGRTGDRKSTRLNSSHLVISYAVFCLKKKKKKQ